MANLPLYTVTIITAQDEVLFQASELFNFIGPAKSYARGLASDPEYIAAGAHSVEITDSADQVVFDVRVAR